MLTVDSLGPAVNDALEVSFPAVRGASGAPLMYMVDRGFYIIGVLVSNAHYHLLPAEVTVSLNTANTALSSSAKWARSPITSASCVTNDLGVHENASPQILV